MVSRNRPPVLFGLVRFDLLRLRRGLEAVLTRWQDRLTLMAMVVCGALAAASGFAQRAMPAVPPMIAALVLTVIAALAAAANDWRLERLARHSVVAPLALARGSRLIYLAMLVGGLLSLALLGAWAVGALSPFALRALPLIFIPWSVGTALGVLMARLTIRPLGGVKTRAAGSFESRRGTLLEVALGSQFHFLSPRRALLLCAALGAGQALVVGFTIGGLGRWTGGAVAAAAALAAMFAVARIPAAVCRFGSWAGIGAGEALGAWLAGPLAAAGAAFAAALPFVGRVPDLPGIELGSGLFVLAVAAARLLHYRLEERARADRLMQLQAAILLLALAGLPPLAPLLVGWRAVALYRANRRALWTSI